MTEHREVDAATDAVAKAIVDAAIAVHRELGPGLLENTYRRCLGHELRLRGHRVCLEVPIPLYYRGESIETGFRADMVVDECVLIELKAVEALSRVHFAQLLTYLRLDPDGAGVPREFQ